MNEAKSNAILNIVSNASVVLVTAIINIWLTRYLVQRLGVEVYGMVPFALSIILYFSLVTLSLTDSISRFVAMSLQQQKTSEANTFFSTALTSLIIICLILLIPLFLTALFLPEIFNVPTGYELDSSLLLIAVAVGSFLLAINSPFTIGVFVRHRFYVTSIIKIVGKFIWVITIVIGFAYISQSLWIVGISYICMNIFVLIGHVYVSKKLTPELRYTFSSFQWRHLRQMTGLSTWILINQLGALLYLNINFVLINLFLGSSAVSFFSPFALWINLLSSLAATMTQVYVPVAFEHIANQRFDILANQTIRAIKLIVLAMGLPVAILCGLAHPILKVWLGEPFGNYWPMTWCLILPWVINMIARPIYSVFRGFNKLKIPAIITLVIGILNISLSIILLTITDWGIYAVAVSLLICWIGKNILFTPIYAASLLNIPGRLFIEALIPGFVLASLMSLILVLTSKYVNLETFFRLTVATLICVIFYTLISFFILKRQDRIFIKSIIIKKVN